MPIEIMERYKREDLKANPEKIFIFGDNFERKGYGGQAAEARDEPNAVGIATKIDVGTLLTDSYFAEVLIREFLPKFTLLKTHLDTGGVLVWPLDGVGTGLAMLPEAAPRLYAKLVELQTWLGVTDAVRSYIELRDKERSAEDGEAPGVSAEPETGGSAGEAEADDGQAKAG